jgi:hypothetical protein
MDFLLRPVTDTHRYSQIPADFKLGRRSTELFEESYGELYIRRLESPIRSPSKLSPNAKLAKTKNCETISQGLIEIQIKKKLKQVPIQGSITSSRSSTTHQNYTLVRATGPEFPVRKILRLPARQRLIDKETSFSREESELANYPYKFIPTNRKTSPVSGIILPQSLRSSTPAICQQLVHSTSIVGSPQTPEGVSTSFQEPRRTRLDVMGKSIRLSRSGHGKRTCKSRNVDSDGEYKVKKTRINMFLPSTEGIYLDNN